MCIIIGEKSLDTFSLETYLQMEAESEIRYEFYDGLIVAMAGGTLEHSAISANVIAGIHASLKAKNNSCHVFGSDAKVVIQNINRRCYPDVSVVCGPIERDTTEPRAITNPILIVEVLSESTEALDRGEKFFAYRQIESLQTYILISQDKALAEVFSRGSEEVWLYQAYSELSQQIALPNLEISLSMEDVYYGVTEGLRD